MKGKRPLKHSLPKMPKAIAQLPKVRRKKQEFLQTGDVKKAARRRLAKAKQALTSSGGETLAQRCPCFVQSRWQAALQRGEQLFVKV